MDHVVGDQAREEMFMLGFMGFVLGKFCYVLGSLKYKKKPVITRSLYQLLFVLQTILWVLQPISVLHLIVQVL